VDTESFPEAPKMEMKRNLTPGFAGSGLLFPGRLYYVDFSLVRHDLDTPDKAAGAAFLDGRCFGGKPRRMDVHFNGFPVSAVRAFHDDLLFILVMDEKANRASHG